MRVLVGRSPAMVELFVKVWRASRHGRDVLIEGETGTGKECVARAIHRYSPRNGAPYVALNMAGARDDVIENELYGHVKGAYTGAGLPHVPTLTREASRLLQEHNWPGNVRELENCVLRAVLDKRRLRIRPRDLELQVGTGHVTGRTTGAGAARYHSGHSPARSDGDPSGTGGSSATAPATRHRTEPQAPVPARSRYSKPSNDAQERDAVVASMIDVAGNKRQAAAQLGMSRSHLYVLLRRHGIREEEWAGGRE